jgi:hypothetical protein
LPFFFYLFGKIFLVHHFYPQHKPTLITPADRAKLY